MRIGSRVSQWLLTIFITKLTLGGELSKKTTTTTWDQFIRGVDDELEAGEVEYPCVEIVDSVVEKVGTGNLWNLR